MDARDRDEHGRQSIERGVEPKRVCARANQAGHQGKAEQAEHHVDEVALVLARFTPPACPQYPHRPQESQWRQLKRGELQLPRQRRVSGGRRAADRQKQERRGQEARTGGGRDHTTHPAHHRDECDRLGRQKRQAKCRGLIQEVHLADEHEVDRHDDQRGHQHHPAGASRLPSSKVPRQAPRKVVSRPSPACTCRPVTRASRPAACGHRPSS